jgi:hypothetical protein
VLALQDRFEIDFAFLLCGTLLNITTAKYEDSSKVSSPENSDLGALLHKILLKPLSTLDVPA